MSNPFYRDVDWEAAQVNSRAMVQSPDLQTGLGDPSRWGSRETLIINAHNVEAYCGQLVRVQVEDPYPRNWYLTGTLEISFAMAASPIEDGDWSAYLDVEMGIGQASVTHRLNLRALIDLCIRPDLALTNQGYYYPMVIGDRASYPFVLPGGLTARTLNVRAACALINVESPIPLGQTVAVNVAVSPFSAGRNENV
jgi:hypothetical protein